MGFLIFSSFLYDKFLLNAFFENLMNGRDPKEVMFNTTGCFDTGPHYGGWEHIVLKMTAVTKS